MATPEGVRALRDFKDLGGLTASSPPVDPKRFSGAMANRPCAFRAVLIAGRFVCLERAHG